MTVYVKELKEAFYSGGEASPYRTRQNVVGYFLDEESCWKDAEAERDFYYTRGYNTDLFSNGKTIYMNTTVEGRGDYTKMTYSWNPIRLLEVNHRGLSAEEFGAEMKYDGAKRYLRGLSTRFEGANNEGFFPAEEEDFEEMVIDEIGEHTELDAEDFDDMGFSLNMDRFSYQNEGKVIGIHDKELRQYRIYFGDEPMFYLNDAVFGYDNNNTVQGVVDDLNEALQDSIKEIFQRLLWKSQRPDSLDVMLRGEDFEAEMASLYDIVFEDDDGKKYTTHPDFDHSIINDMIEDDDLVPMEAEEYKHCDGCEEVRSIEEFSLSNDPEQTLTEGEVCDYCFGDFYDAEGINLRKRIESLIDLREINFTGFKKDTKRDAVKRARRIENEIKGVLPKGKSYKVDKPKWFKIAQTGIVLGVAGLVGYSGFKGKE